MTTTMSSIKELNNIHSMTTEDIEEFKKLWLQNVLKENCSNNSSFLTKKKLDDIIATLQHGGTATSARKSNWYAWNIKFMVINVQGKPRLLYRPRKGDDDVAMDQMKEAVCVEDAFKIIHSCHVSNGHPKGLSLYKRLVQKYGKSITKNMCIHFSNLCPDCQRQMTKKPTQAGHTPLLSEGFGARYQIDLIDFQYLAAYNGPKLTSIT